MVVVVFGFVNLDLDVIESDGSDVVFLLFDFFVENMFWKTDGGGGGVGIGCVMVDDDGTIGRLRSCSKFSELL